MAKTIIAFDESDKTLGSFFLDCKLDLDNYFAENSIDNTQLNSAKLNEIAIGFVTDGHPSFIFGAYSHGDSDCLLEAANNSYISINQNGSCFKNSFFYTFSCSAGKALGKELITSGCLCFIGYKDEVAVWSTYTKPFISCANYGITQFFNGYTTINIFSQMKEKYNHEIDEAYKMDYLIASILMENRDALVMHGHDIAIHNLPV